MNTLEVENIIKQLQIKKNVGRDIIVTGTPSNKLNKKQLVSVSSHPLNHFSEYHTHSFFEFNYVFKGSCINLVEDEIVHMNSGDLIILHPGTFHTLYADESCIVYNFIVNKDWLALEIDRIMPTENAVYSFLERANNEDYYKYVVCPNTIGNSGICSSADKLIELTEKSSACINILFEAYMIEILYHLIEESDKAYLSKDKGANDYKMINMLLYVAENYATVTLEELADRFFYSKTHVCRLFLQNTGKTFNQTLMQMRINHACVFLKNTEMSVEDIARSVGYDSVEYFQRLFKKRMGITPGEFRRIGNTEKILC